MRPHPAIGLLILAAIGQPAAGFAKTVKLPEKKPLVSFEVPDDWTLTPTAGGLEMTAPDHTAVIEVGVVKRAKSDIVAWQKGATQRMKAFGVSFDPSINPQRPTDGRPAKGDPTDIGHIFNLPKDRPDLAINDLPSWSMAPALAPQQNQAPQTPASQPGPSSGGAAVDTKDRTASASPPAAAQVKANEAKPSEAKPNETKPNETKPNETKSSEAKPVETKPTDAKADEAKASDSKASDSKPANLKPVEAQAGEGKAGESKAGEGKAKAAAKLPHFRSLVLYGGVLGGKPVDVQFLDFSATGALAFVMQQESSASDDRTGAVINSVRFLR